MRQELVSVIVPVYNGAQCLRRAIDSVRAQSYPHWECLVVDDGSTDGTVNLAAELAKNDEQIRVLQHPDRGNHGTAATRNLALGQSRGEFVAFLDADDEWLPEKLSLQLEQMRSVPQAGWCYSVSRILRDTAVNYQSEAEFQGQPPSQSRPQLVLDVVSQKLQYTFSSVLCRKSAALAVGGFDENLPYQSEDRIFVARLAADFDVAFLDHPLCLYHLHEQSYTVRVIREKLARRICLDLQVRVIQWCHAGSNHQDLAQLLIHESLLPFMFACSARSAAIQHYLWSVRRLVRTPLLCIHVTWLVVKRLCCMTLVLPGTRRSHRQCTDVGGNQAERDS